jgi:hypothetical protein
MAGTDRLLHGVARAFLLCLQVTLHVRGLNSRFHGIGTTTNHNMNAMGASSARGIQGVMNERPARQQVEYFR